MHAPATLGQLCPLELMCFHKPPYTRTLPATHGRLSLVELHIQIPAIYARFQLHMMECLLTHMMECLHT